MAVAFELRKNKNVEIKKKKNCLTIHSFSIYWYNGFQHKYYKIHQKALLQV